MSWKDGWPTCESCGVGIGYEGVFTVDGKDYCVWCQPPEDREKSIPEIGF